MAISPRIAQGRGGEVLEYTLSATALELETIGYLVASQADDADGFGFAVATSADGRTLAIGAPTGNEPSIEAVHVFARSAVDDRWLQSRYIKAPNPDADDHFGGAFLRGALALSGDATTLVAPAADEDGPNDATPENVEESLRACASAGCKPSFVASCRARSNVARAPASRVSD